MLKRTIQRLASAVAFAAVLLAPSAALADQSAAAPVDPALVAQAGALLGIENAAVLPESDQIIQEVFEANSVEAVLAQASSVATSSGFAPLSTFVAEDEIGGSYLDADVAYIWWADGTVMIDVVDWCYAAFPNGTYEYYLQPDGAGTYLASPTMAVESLGEQVILFEETGDGTVLLETLVTPEWAYATGQVENEGDYSLVVYTLDEETGLILGIEQFYVAADGTLYDELVVSTVEYGAASPKAAEVDAMLERLATEPTHSVIAVLDLGAENERIYSGSAPVGDMVDVILPEGYVGFWDPEYLYPYAIDWDAAFEGDVCVYAVQPDPVVIEQAGAALGIENAWPDYDGLLAFHGMYAVNADEFIVAEVGSARATTTEGMELVTNYVDEQGMFMSGVGYFYVTDSPLYGYGYDWYFDGADEQYVYTVCAGDPAYGSQNFILDASTLQELVLWYGFDDVNNTVTFKTVALPQVQAIWGYIQTEGEFLVNEYVFDLETGFLLSGWSAVVAPDGTVSQMSPYEVELGGQIQEGEAQQRAVMLERLAGSVGLGSVTVVVDPGFEGLERVIEAQVPLGDLVYVDLPRDYALYADAELTQPIENIIYDWGDSVVVYAA